MKFASLLAVLAVAQAGIVAPGSDCTAHADCSASNACCGTTFDGATNVCSGNNQADPNGDASFTCNVYSTPGAPGSNNSGSVLTFSAAAMLLSIYMIA